MPSEMRQNKYRNIKNIKQDPKMLKTWGQGAPPGSVPGHLIKIILNN